MIPAASRGHTISPSDVDTGSPTLSPPKVVAHQDTYTLSSTSIVGTSRSNGHSCPPLRALPRQRPITPSKLESRRAHERLDADAEILTDPSWYLKEYGSQSHGLPLARWCV